MIKLLEQVSLLYEDDDVAAINKPAGLIVHADGRSKEVTIADWIVKKYPQTENVGEPLTLSDGTVVKRQGIVHRLDAETSGVLLFAKTSKGHAALKKQFLDRTIEKTYQLFAYGILKEDEGIINRPIGRSKNDFRKWLAGRGTRGELREAVTAYKVLSRDKEVSFVEAYPKTGRTHQIRVHFKAINHPVVCDSLYAPNQACIFGFERVALHALRIEFTNTKGEKIKVEAPYPEDFQSAIKQISNS